MTEATSDLPCSSAMMKSRKTERTNTPSIPRPTSRLTLMLPTRPTGMRSCHRDDQWEIDWRFKTVWCSGILGE